MFDLCSVLQIIICPFVFYLLTIVLSVFLRVHLQLLLWFLLLDFNYLCSVLYIIICPLSFFLLTIELSVPGYHLCTLWTDGQSRSQCTVCFLLASRLTLLIRRWCWVAKVCWLVGQWLTSIRSSDWKASVYFYIVSVH